MPFTFESPVSFFEKAEAPAGQQKRIAGVISTESPDRQDEVVLQRGLDFSDFAANGWYNDNHTKDTDGILGYPDAGSIRQFRKGEKLPDGTKAASNGTWAEGYLLETDKAKRICELGKALQKTGRPLGFSIEGRIERREGPNRKIIAKALVRNVAITNCPVNTDSRMEVLAKSLRATMASEADEMEPVNKTLTAGAATPGVAVAAEGAHTGTGAGHLLSPQSLEQGKKKRPKNLVKALTDEEAIAWVQNRLPGVSEAVATRFVLATRALKAQGRL